MVPPWELVSYGNCVLCVYGSGGTEEMYSSYSVDRIILRARLKSVMMFFGNVNVLCSF